MTPAMPPRMTPGMMPEMMSEMMSEGIQVQTVSDDPRVTRARLHVASALMIAERGRPAEAERRLREALGVLERRRRFAGAARAAATLGCLLRERGEPSRAESTLERARVLFAAAETTTEWSPLTGKRPKSPSDTLTVHPGEREDYVLARALLWAGGGTDDRQSAGPSAGDGLARVADGTIELFRTQTCGDGLETICARLGTIIDATAIAVLSPTAATTPLVTAGPLPHAIGRRARELRLSTRGVSIDGGDGSAQAVVPIRAPTTIRRSRVSSRTGLARRWQLVTPVFTVSSEWLQSCVPQRSIWSWIARRINRMSMATENRTFVATENCTLLGRTSRAERTFSR